MTITNPQTGLRVSLPGEADVEPFAPEAAQAIREFNRLDAEFPAHRTADQLNELDDAHGRAVALLLEPSVEHERAKVRASRAKAIRDALDNLDRRWAEEEADRGFDRWRTTFQTGRPQIAGISYSSSGGRVTIGGRKVISSLRDAIAA